MSQLVKDILSGAVTVVIVLAFFIWLRFGVMLPSRANSAFDECVENSGVVRVIGGEVQCSYVHTVVKP